MKLPAKCPNCGRELEVFIDASSGSPDEAGTECDCGAIPVWKVISWYEFDLGDFSHDENGLIPAVEVAP
jgi:hypothetical protein